jgi:hypothetical protein
LDLARSDDMSPMSSKMALINLWQVRNTLARETIVLTNFGDMFFFFENGCPFCDKRQSYDFSPTMVNSNIGWVLQAIKQC